MCSRVYLLDGGETVRIYSEVEHEVLKIMLNPWPISTETASPTKTWSKYDVPLLGTGGRKIAS